MRINILGTIVSPDYDDAMFASWIDRGVITPSSRVVSALENATEPVDLYVSSYGGDVFAGGEMLIALQKARADGRLNSVEVGSIAASMAANIVASLRASGMPVIGHANSQLMFHGCYTSTEGGAQHHEDVAASLRAINDSVVASLNKIGITECRAWFNEGREKWIGADEAVDLKLFTSVSEEAAKAAPEGKRTASRLAAFAAKFHGRTEYTMDIDTQVTAEAEAPVEAQAQTETKAPFASPAPVAQEVPETVTLEECEKRLAGLQATKDKQISELTAKLGDAEKGLEAAKADLSSLLERAEKAEKALAETQAALETERHNRESVVTAALAPAPEKFDGDARKMLASLPMSQREGFYKAHKAELDQHK